MISSSNPTGFTVTYFHPSKADVGVVFYKRQ
jgi:hypothetical protein